MKNEPIVTYNHDAGNYGVFQKDEDGQWVVLFSYDNHPDAATKCAALKELLSDG